MLRRTRRSAAIGAALLVAQCAPTTPDDARVPTGYPRHYAETIAAGEREGVVDIWSSTDSAQARDLIAGFHARYPRVAVRYSELGSSELYARAVDRTRRGGAVGDILWSSAMDLQIKLVNDSVAQSYRSPERGAIPHWANWKNQAWGITGEPIVMIYNRRLMAAATAPTSHLDLRRALDSAARPLAGRVATYDPAISALGYLVLSQDDMARRDLWGMVRALSSNRVRLFGTTEAIIADVAAGHSIVGYNVVGSYAAEEQRANPNLAVVLPRDYTLVMSRIALIPARAPHPNAARLFLDYMLSRDGQQRLALHSMSSVRSDVPTPERLQQPTMAMRAIRVGPALLVQQDQMTRQHFMRQWQRAIADGASVAPDQLRP